MAATRSKSGIAKPRQIAYEIAEAIKAPKKKVTKKTPAAKANESKPRTKVAGKVTKSKKAAPATKSAATTAATKKPAVKKAKAKTETANAVPNHEPTLMEKAEGIALTVQGYIMGKPGKKAAGTAKIRGTSRKGTTSKAAKAAA